MLSPLDQFLTAGLPLLISLVIVLIGRGKRWSYPLAIGLAFVCVFASIEGWRVVWNATSNAPFWLVYIGLGATLGGVSFGAWRAPIWIRLPVLMIFVAASGGAMLSYYFTNHIWTPLNGAIALAVFAVCASVIAYAVQPQQTAEPIVGSLAMSMIAGLGGLTVMMLADQTVGQGIAALGVSLLPVAGSAIIAKRRGDTADPSAAAFVFAAILTLSLVCAVHVSDVPMLPACLIAGAAPLFWLTRFIPHRRLAPWLFGLLRLLVTAIPLVIAVIMGVKAVQENQANPEVRVAPAIFGYPVTV